MSQVLGSLDHQEQPPLFIQCPNLTGTLKTREEKFPFTQWKARMRKEETCWEDPGVAQTRADSGSTSEEARIGQRTQI